MSEVQATIRPVEITDEILEVVRQYVDREITRSRAAAQLKLSERQITRLLEELGLDRVQSRRAQEEEQAAKRRLAKEQAAQAVAAGQATVHQAALRAGVHPRTITRLVERLKKPKKR